jgi:hypothetical protein
MYDVHAAAAAAASTSAGDAAKKKKKKKHVACGHSCNLNTSNLSCGTPELPGTPDQ